MLVPPHGAGAVPPVPEDVEVVEPVEVEPDVEDVVPEPPAPVLVPVVLDVSPPLPAVLASSSPHACVHAPAPSSAQRHSRATLDPRNPLAVMTPHAAILPAPRRGSQGPFHAHGHSCRF